MSELEELDCCRLCFSQQDLTDDLFPANGQPNKVLIEMIQACTSIRITFEKDFNSPICSDCVRMVKQFHSYRRKCLLNDSELKQSRGESDNLEDSDPLSCGQFQPETEYESRGRFHERLKRQIKCFLERQTKKIERMALAKLNYELFNREADADYELEFDISETLTKQEAMSEQDLDVDFQPSCSEKSNVDWKKKYLTLQKNNELLQKAFQEQKERIKATEQLFKSSISSINDLRFKEHVSPQQPVQGGFTGHAAIPEISVEFLQNINHESGSGEKGDRNFVSKLAVAVFGEDTLANSSVTGRPSNAHNHLPPKPPLCPQKIAAIGLKLFERVQLEVGPMNQEELLTRSHEKLIRLIICQKSMNLRKQYVKRGLHLDDLEPSPEAGRKKMRR
ncbi:uncharacterized protein LOC129721783 [Wyeomyia smithii]|uniref:uncharacterized protein LOC129721783 n=1 Tax=Wyeomyia smithii TaxID=174621 RepID=UPI002467FAD8|nr:uncharacterized protein LOC129721783 [Wyeomyia smithii]